MMSADFENELLSSLLDRELSPEQAESVRGQIAESGDLGGELDALKSVSRLLKSVPTESAPADLHANVMASIGMSPVKSPATQPAKSPRGRKSYFGAITGVVLAAAACVFIAVNFESDGPANERVAKNAAPSGAQRDSSFIPQSKAQPMTRGAGSADMASLSPPAASMLQEDAPSPIAEQILNEQVARVRAGGSIEILRKQLALADLTTIESKQATSEGYVAFVVEGPRESIQSVLKQFQNVTGDTSLQLDRSGIPASVLREFEMSDVMIASNDSAVPSMRNQGLAPGKGVGGGGAGFGGARERARIPAPAAIRQGSVGGREESVEADMVRQARPESAMPVNDRDDEEKMAPKSKTQAGPPRPAGPPKKDLPIAIAQKPTGKTAIRVLFFCRSSSQPAKADSSTSPCDEV